VRTKTKKVNIKYGICGNKVSVTEQMISDVYFIEQNEDGRFYITSENGYNGFDGNGFADLEFALKQVKKSIKDFFRDRCEDDPKEWQKSTKNNEIKRKLI